MAEAVLRDRTLTIKPQKTTGHNMASPILEEDHFVPHQPDGVRNQSVKVLSGSPNKSERQDYKLLQLHLMNNGPEDEMTAAAALQQQHTPTSLNPSQMFDNLTLSQQQQ